VQTGPVDALARLGRLPGEKTFPLRRFTMRAYHPSYFAIEHLGSGRK
jgi:hypothetical protein